MNTAEDRPPTDGSPTEPSFDAAESRRLIAESQQRLRSGTEPDGRLLLLVWGVAWGIGYLCLWLSARDTGGIPSGPAFAVFFVALAAAIATTIVHAVRRTAGTRGPSARAGTLWGAGWGIGFLVYPFVIGGVANAGAPDAAVGLVANALACVIVGLMYIGGGACFLDTRLYVLGAWILVVGGVSTIAGIPGTYLVMCLAGGGGFLVMAAVETAITARRRRAGAPSTAGAAVGQDDR